MRNYNFGVMCRGDTYNPFDDNVTNLSGVLGHYQTKGCTGNQFGGMCRNPNATNVGDENDTINDLTKVLGHYHHKLQSDHYSIHDDIPAVDTVEDVLGEYALKQQNQHHHHAHQQQQRWLQHQQQQQQQQQKQKEKEKENKPKKQKYQEQKLQQQEKLKRQRQEQKHLRKKQKEQERQKLQLRQLESIKQQLLHQQQQIKLREQEKQHSLKLPATISSSSDEYYSVDEDLLDSLQATENGLEIYMDTSVDNNDTHSKDYSKRSNSKYRNRCSENSKSYLKSTNDAPALVKECDEEIDLIMTSLGQISLPRGRSKHLKLNPKSINTETREHTNRNLDRHFVVSDDNSYTYANHKESNTCDRNYAIDYGNNGGKGNKNLFGWGQRGQKRSRRKLQEQDIVDSRSFYDFFFSCRRKGVENREQIRREKLERLHC